MIVDVVGELDEGYRSAALGGLFVLFCWPENGLVAAIYTTPETGIFFGIHWEARLSDRNASAWCRSCGDNGKSSVMMEASALGQGRGDGSYPSFAELVLRHLQDLEDTTLTDRPPRRAGAPR